MQHGRIGTLRSLHALAQLLHMLTEGIKLTLHGQALCSKVSHGLAARLFSCCGISLHLGYVCISRCCRSSPISATAVRRLTAWLSVAGFKDASWDVSRVRCSFIMLRLTLSFDYHREATLHVHVDALPAVVLLREPGVEFILITNLVITKNGTQRADTNDGSRLLPRACSSSGAASLLGCPASVLRGFIGRLCSWRLLDFELDFLQCVLMLGFSLIYCRQSLTNRCSPRVAASGNSSLALKDRHVVMLVPK
jgi:hypothetical protein